MLGDAASTKPALIPYNPALRRRNRGRRRGRRLSAGTAAHLRDPVPDVADRRFGGRKNPAAVKTAILAIAHTLLKIGYEVLRSGKPRGPLG
jgi:hypothetical protein